MSVTELGTEDGSGVVNVYIGIIFESAVVGHGVCSLIPLFAVFQVVVVTSIEVSFGTARV